MEQMEKIVKNNKNRGRSAALTVRLLICCLLGLLLSGCGAREAKDGKPGLTGRMELSYADQFSVDEYEGGYYHVRIEGDQDFVLIPEGAKETDLGIPGAVMVDLPADHIYLAASVKISYNLLIATVSSLSDNNFDPCLI